jgi:hypothetical protein
MVFVDFFLTDYSSVNELSDFSQIDAACKIASEAAQQHGLQYGKDFWFVESYWDNNGNRLLKFGFNDEQVAFMIKLKGPN